MRRGKLGEVKQCQAIMALDSKDCSEVANNQELDVQCPLPNENWELRGLGALET